MKRIQTGYLLNRVEVNLISNSPFVFEKNVTIMSKEIGLLSIARGIGQVMFQENTIGTGLWAVCSILLYILLQLLGMHWGIITLTAPFVVSVWAVIICRDFHTYNKRLLK